MDYKKNLKAAKDCLGTGDYAQAKTLSYSVSNDASAPEAMRFNAHLFYALASQNLGEFKLAESAYRDAIKLNPASPMPYNGLIGLFEKSKDLDGLLESLKDLHKVLLLSSQIDTKKYAQISMRLLNLLEAEEDWIESLKILNSVINCYNESIAVELATLIPVGETLSSPLHFVLNKAITIQEKNDAEEMHRQIELRRRRLGASDLKTTRSIVESEIVANSKLDFYCEKLLQLLHEAPSSWATTILLVKEKLLEFLAKKIKHLGNEKEGNSEKRLAAQQLLSISQDLIDQGSSSPIAFECIINTMNVTQDDYDLNVIKAAVTACPVAAIGLASSGYLKLKSTEHSVDEAMDDVIAALDLDDQSGDYESTIVFCKKVVGTLLKTVQKDFGIVLDAVCLSVDILLAESYCKIGPKFHQDAVSLYLSILSRSKSNISALQGIAAAYSMAEKYAEALGYLTQVYERDRTNDQAISEIGWIHFCTGAFDEAKSFLTQAIEINGESALHFYRLGKVLWAIGGDSQNEAYNYFLSSVKINPKLPGAFTAIGLFCLHIEENVLRAEKCFQKALQVNPADEEAAIELAKLILLPEEEDDDDDEYCHHRVNVAKARNNEHANAITQFQTSLRLDTKSSTSWEGLGEAYALEGKYMAALKAFTRAHELKPMSFFSVYQNGIIKMKLGLYFDAISDFNAVKFALVGSDDNESHTKISEDSRAGLLIPCLESTAECWLLYGKETFAGGAYGVCLDQLTNAIVACLEIFENQASKRVEYQSVFKILGDACVELYIFRNTHVNTALDVDLIDRGMKMLGLSGGGNWSSVDGTVSLYGKILRFAAAAYRRAIRLASTSKAFSVLVPGYQHDLAAVYHYLHYLESKQLLADGENHMYLKLCVANIWKALHAEPGNANFWNSLGVFTLQAHAKIAQHALIKSAEINEKILEPWTNLGYFYYFNNDYDLSKQAFNRAQLIDPENCLGWYGQALINTKPNKTNLGAESPLDLFDHANSLAQGQNVEVSFSYALSEYERFIREHGNDTIAGVLADPVFSMLKFCEIRSDDIAGFTLLGSLRELQGRFEDACAAFEKALNISKNQNVAAEEIEITCLINYARALCSSQNYIASVVVYGELFEKSSQSSVLVHVGFGLALFFSDRLEDSLNSFQNALDMLSSLGQTDGDLMLQNKVRLMLSQVLYALGTDVHLELAKNQLMECVQRPGGFPQALISLLALAMVSQNDELAQGAASELIKERPESLGALDQARNLILSRFFLLNGSNKLSRGFLAKNIHQSPWKASNWLLLAENMERYAPEIIDSHIIITRSAVRLQHSNAKSSAVDKAERALISQVHGHALLTRLRPNKIKINSLLNITSRSYFHAAVHANPSNAHIWLSLGISTHKDSIISDSDSERKALAKITQSIARNAKIISDKDSAVKLDWADILHADASIILAQIELKFDGNDVLAHSTLRNVMDETEHARLNSECIDRRVMAAGYTVGARALLAMGDLITCFGAYRNAIIISPESVNLWEELGEVYACNGRFSQAVACFVQGLSVARTDEAKYLVLTRLARIYCIIEDSEEFNAAMGQIRELWDGSSSKNSSLNGKFFTCLGMLRFGNNVAAAATKIKKIVAGALEEGNGQCLWAKWILDLTT
ncbi:Tetratricopeptide repeat protein 37 [Physocladia obscura]|uniref:Tetratricopeptide repeat protein 37 n=1 Tax=Physocladia obscura TaxID=109957 RepID=A0AAD5TAY8_9FUNG|nr:Tetratricopeptide repeat protein 37 [Physocladia obscura]